MLVAIAGAVFYFLPASAKIKGTDFIVERIPETWKAEAEELLLTPQEERAKLVADLSTQLEVVKEKLAPEDESLITEGERILAELKKKNDEASFAEIAKGKIIETLISRKPAVTCEPQ